MKPQITRKLRWFEIETDAGTFWVPVEDMLSSDISEADILNAYTYEDDETEVHVLRVTEGFQLLAPVRVVGGWGVRLSAPGYLDYTPWEVYENEEEAERALAELSEDEGEEE